MPETGVLEAAPGGARAGQSGNAAVKGDGDDGAQPGTGRRPKTPRKAGSREGSP